MSKDTKLITNKNEALLRAKVQSQMMLNAQTSGIEPEFCLYYIKKVKVDGVNKNANRA